MLFSRVSRWLCVSLIRTCPGVCLSSSYLELVEFPGYLCSYRSSDLESSFIMSLFVLFASSLPSAGTPSVCLLACLVVSHRCLRLPLLKNMPWLPAHLGPFPKLGVWRPTEIWPFLYHQVGWPSQQHHTTRPQGDRAPVLCTGLGRPSLCPQGKHVCFRRLGQQWGSISELSGMPAGIGAPWLAEWVEVGDICTSPPGRGAGSQAWLEYHQDSVRLWWTVLF